MTPNPSFRIIRDNSQYPAIWKVQSWKLGIVPIGNTKEYSYKEVEVKAIALTSSVSTKSRK